MKVYVLFNEGEIEGIYTEKDMAESIKNTYLNMSVLNHIKENNYVN